MNGRLPAWLRDRRLVAALLFLVTLLVYLPAIFWGTFHYDDGHSLVENPGIRSLANIPRFFVEPQLWSAEPGNLMYRPVLLVTCALDYAAWGLNPAGWLLANAMVHGLAAVLVYRLALRLGLGELAAALAGAVFALHPAISEVQNYVSSRSESVAAVLLLAALHLHLCGGFRGVAGAFVALVAALLTKENAAPFCGVVACYELVAARGELRTRALRAAGFLVLYAIPAVVVLFVVRPAMLHVAALPVALVHAAAGADPQIGAGRSYLGNAMVQARVQVAYLRMLVTPVGLNIDHDVAITASATKVVAAFAIHAAGIGAAAWASIRRHRLLPLCVGWWWALSLVTFLQPLNVVMNEHRLYLPMIAVALLAGAALARVAETFERRGASAGRAAALAALPLMAFVALVVQRSHEWRTDESLWTVAVERSPNSARAHMHLGAVWHLRANDSDDRDEKLRDYDLALAHYARSDELHPGWPDLFVNVGNARIERGRITHERADFEKALDAYVRFGDIVGRDRQRPRMLQAVAHAELGDVDRAVAIAEKLKSEDSSMTRLYDDQIARFLRRKGDKQGAAAAMQRVIAIDAKDERTEGLLDLAWWRFEDGDLDGSQELIQRALALAEKHPAEFRPYLWAARFLVLTGRQPEAEEMFRLARRHGWSAPESEVRWVAGGRTPGVFTGTAGTRPQAPK